MAQIIQLVITASNMGILWFISLQSARKCSCVLLVHATEDGNFSRLHFAWKRLKFAHFWWHSSKLTSKRPLNRVSCPISAVRLHSFGRVVVCEEKETRFLTVFRTLLKYMKLTATPMIWRRMAARVTSPRHCRDAELAMAQRGDGTQMSSEQQENTSSGQDESVQALLLRREGAERGGSEEEGGRRRIGGGARQGCERAAASMERQVRRVQSILSHRPQT